MLDIYGLAALHLDPRHGRPTEQDALWLLGIGEGIAGLWSAHRWTTLLAGWGPARAELGCGRGVDCRPVARA